MKTAIVNGRLVLPYGVREGSILIEDGRIADVTIGQSPSPSDADVIDAGGRYVSPGFIDMHTHGAGGYDFMDGTVDDIYGACRAHLEHGTTTILPTSMTSTKESLFDFIGLFNSVELVKDGCPEILGLHLEGPYFAASQCGAQDPAFLRAPDKAEYAMLLAACPDILRWTIAPELPGALEMGDWLAAHGAAASVGHSNATYEQVCEAALHGFRSITHLYSVMSTITREGGYRRAGVVESAYLLPGLFCELIADGRHLPP